MLRYCLLFCFLFKRNKKSTRTAYAVAIVAIVVLLGALAMMYKDVETGFVGTCW